MSINTYTFTDFAFVTPSSIHGSHDNFQIKVELINQKLLDLPDAINIKIDGKYF